MANIIKISESQIARYHPLDLLHDVNPEIGSLAYADKEGLISPGLRPTIALFRGFQSREKIESIRAMSKMYGYDTILEIERVNQDGKTRRRELKEQGLTERDKNNGKVLIELQKLKYDCARGIVQDHIEGQKYLSDNHLRAVSLEAQAHAETIKFAEQLRAETLQQISRNDLEARIKEAQAKQITLLKSAEIERGAKQDSHQKEIAIAYITQQARINQLIIQAQIDEEWAKTELGKEYFRTMGQLGSEGMRALAATGRKNLSFISNGAHGEMSFKINLE